MARWSGLVRLGCRDEKMYRDVEGVEGLENRGHRCVFAGLKGFEGVEDLDHAGGVDDM